MLCLAKLMFIFIVFGSLLKIMLSEKIISILLTMEMMMMGVYFFYFSFFDFWFADSVLNIIFLSFMVCESVLGLGSYIYLTRLSGKDSFKSLNLLK